MKLKLAIFLLELVLDKISRDDEMIESANALALRRIIEKLNEIKNHHRGP